MLASLIEHTTEFDGLDAADILVVLLGAHGTIAASVRGLDEVARSVVVRRTRRRVELGLRPPFFVTGDASRRLATLVHELLHLDPKRPGQLLESRRHKHRAHHQHEEQARAIATQRLVDLPPARLAPLAHHGPVRLPTWIQRPVAGTSDVSFTDANLMEVTLEMKTPKKRRSVWW